MKDLCLLIVAQDDYQFRPLFELGIKPTLEMFDGLSLRLLNINRVATSEVIILLDQAKIVIVDLDKDRSDTSYVAGICHGRAFRTILICRRNEDAPLLLQSYPKIVYGSDSNLERSKDFANELAVFLRQAEQELYRPSTPLEDYMPPDKKQPVSLVDHLRLKKALDELRAQYRDLQEEMRTIYATREIVNQIMADGSPDENKESEAIVFRRISPVN